MCVHVVFQGGTIENQTHEIWLVFTHTGNSFSEVVVNETAVKYQLFEIRFPLARIMRSNALVE